MKTAIAVISGVMVACVACAHLPFGGGEMKAKKVLGWAMGTYNKGYLDYQAVAAIPGLGTDRLEVLRKKKKIMADAWPKIRAFDEAVLLSQAPPEELEREIVALLNRLFYGDTPRGKEPEMSAEMFELGKALIHAGLTYWQLQHEQITQYLATQRPAFYRNKPGLLLDL